MQTLFGFILAMSITMVLIPLLMRWAVPLGILDIPEARKVHVTPVPRVGGIAMAAGVLASVLLWGGSTRELQAMLMSIVILLVFGVWDDRKTLPAGPKFLGQAIAALVVMGWGGVCIATVTGSERMPLPGLISMPLTFLFLMGGTNAFNLADGLDGLAGGMAMLCLCGTALLAFTGGTPLVGSMAVVLVGALLGFLRFNTHPARVFMGDGGSQVLGFCASALAILLTQDSQTPFSTALPLLLLGVPIIDTLMVMTERMAHGLSPFKADRRHIHHRLLALGFEHWEAVSVLYLLQGIFFVAAWFLRYDTDARVLAAFLCIATLVLFPIRFAQLMGFQLRGGDSGDWAVDTMVSRRGSYTIPKAVAGGVLAGCLVAFAVWVLFRGAAPSRDLQMLALALGLVLLATLPLRWRSDDMGWPAKVALYSSAALSMFLAKQAFPDSLHPPLFECILFPAVALAVVVCIRTSKERPFRITPLDILVLLVVITVPNLPGSIASARSLGLAVAEVVLLFYALEALSFAASHRWRWLAGSAAVFLFGLALRAGF